MWRWATGGGQWEVGSGRWFPFPKFSEENMMRRVRQAGVGVGGNGGFSNILLWKTDHPLSWQHAVHPLIDSAFARART